MIGSFQIRTDLALEAREGYDGDESRIRALQYRRNPTRRERFILRWCGLKQKTEPGP